MQTFPHRTLGHTNKSASLVILNRHNPTRSRWTHHNNRSQLHDTSIFLRNINSIIFLELLLHFIPIKLILSLIQLFPYFLEYLLHRYCHIIQFSFVFYPFSPNCKLYCRNCLMIIRFICRACCDYGSVSLSW